MIHFTYLIYTTFLPLHLPLFPIHYIINLLFCFFVLLNRPHLFSIFFFFNDTATTEIYTLSLHDALPISTIAALGTPNPAARTRPFAPGTSRSKAAFLNPFQIRRRRL